MRIIHAHKYFYQRAGAERVMFGLMRRQEARGHEVAPFAMRYPKNEKTPFEKYFVSELETENGVRSDYRLFSSFGRALWSLEAKKKMAQLIADFKPDVVHAHNLYTHLSPSVLAACHEAKVPVVMSIHDYALLSANYALWDGNHQMDLAHRSIFATAQTRFIKGSYAATLGLDVIRSLHEHLRLYDRYISRYLASSHAVKDAFVACGYDAKKIFIDSLFSDAPIQKSKTDDEGFVLYAGRLESYKGVDRLIDAMKILKKSIVGPDPFSLIVAGSGPEEARLRKRAEGLPVQFVGQLPAKELWDLMRRARVVVVPSLWREPFGLVVLEAMAQGTPVVVSDRGALPEIIEDGVSGTVFHADDPGDLARVLRPYLSRPAMALEQGRAAAARAEILGNPEEYTDRVLRHYQAIK